MKKVKYIECDICGKMVKSQGIGGHKALVHGVVEKVILSNTSKDMSTRVQRPAAYIKKKEQVIGTRVDAMPTPNFDMRPDLVGMYKCSICGKHYSSTSEYSGRNFAGNENVKYCWSCHVERNSVRDEMGRRMCKNCGRWFGDTVPAGYPCVKGKEHEF